MSIGHHHDASDGDAVLGGVRIVDRTTGIAGPYCSKVLADAGAEVVKVEPPGGDPLRARGGGALFQFLHTSKRSVSSSALGDREEDLLSAADILLTNDPRDVGEARRIAPSLVVTTITPYGCRGPWVDRPWTEFVLQAACGSTGGRGVPEDPPLSAGGRIGEWVAGTYAALGTLAAFREARRSGHGDHVDVAILDCMAVTMVTCPSVFASFAGWPPIEGTGRSIQVPSVEPTKDGYFVVTTNSGQQFQDFLVMIGRPDLADDAELAQHAIRFQRRHEFLAAVHRHTTARTTEEVLEEAALLRIPAGPVHDGSTVTRFAHFVDQGVYVDNPSGRFVQPRVPYRISGLVPRPFEPAPELPDPDTGADGIDWPRRPPGVGDPRRVDGPDADAGWQLPLAGLRVLDCTAWWAGPSATHALAALGADVVKVESITRPDAMRFAATRRPPDAGWYEWGPLFHSMNVGKRGVTLDLAAPDGVAAFERLADRADVVIENFTPRVMEQFGLTWERLHARNPSLIMVRMPAFGLSGPWRDRTGFAQTMECLSGMAWLTGFADGPPVLVLGACDPLAGMHAVIATLLALLERDRSGAGRMVESVMVEAALNAAAEQVAVYGATGQLLRRTGNRSPDAVPQGVYPCAGPDCWVAIAAETHDQWQALCGALGDPSWDSEEDLGAPEARRRHHDAIDAVITSWTERLDPETAAEILVGAGVPAAAVVPAREVVHNPQVRARGLFEVEHHPVTGDHEVPMLPFRLSRVRRWLRAPAPTLGQHNDEVLAEAGFAPEAIAAMRDRGIIGEGFATS